MAPATPKQPITDRDVARVLYTATGIVNPVLDVLENIDLLGLKRATREVAASSDDDSLLATVAHAIVWATDQTGAPGTARWEKWTVDQRTAWWVDRVGALGTVVVAYPGVFGVLADRLPIQDLVGFAHQAIIICAVQRVHGVRDRHDQTDQLAALLCDRVVDSRRLLADGADDRLPARHGVRISSPLDLVKSVWAVVGLLRSITDVLSHRPQPKQPWRLLSKLPVVGAVADYVGERAALSRAADAATASLRAPVHV